MTVRKNSKVVAVHGSYFANNFGDTLLIKLLCDRVASIVGPQNVYLAVDGLAEEQQAIGYPVLPKEKKHLASHLLFAGGGYFGEPHGHFLERMKWSLRNQKRHLSWWRDFRNARCSILGVGYGPITDPLFRWRVKKLVKVADPVLLRDQESLSYLRCDKAKVCVDYALSIKGRVEPKDKRTIGLHLYGIDDDRRLEIINAVTTRYPNEDIILLDDSGVSTSSEQLMTRVVKLRHGNSVTTKSYEDVTALLELIDNCKLLITTKLHVGIVGIASGAKVISLPIHQKTIRLYRQLDLEAFCVPQTQYSVQRLEKMFPLLDNFVPNRQVIAEGIARVEAAIAEALK